MKRHGMTKSLRLALISMLVVVFVLSACSTGSPTAETPAANQPAEVADNTTDTQNSQNSAPAENTTEDQAPTEAPADEQPAEDPPAEDSSASEISYAGDVLPILESRCIQCHGGERIEGELVMLSYDELMAGGKDGIVVVPGDTDNSLMAQLLIEQKMPKRGPKLTPAQTQIILDWINQGALNN